VLAQFVVVVDNQQLDWASRGRIHGADSAIAMAAGGAALTGSLEDLREKRNRELRAGDLRG
jgi:hypothetical protein